MSLLATLCPQPPDWTIDWAAVDRLIDRAALAATPQSPDFHAEGDVWTHTVMVLEALVGLPAWRALDPGARAVVFAGALLHDLGKQACTRLGPDGRLTSRGHSARGDLLARRLLWEAGVSFGEREHVCALIRHHQVPLFLIEHQPAAARQTLARISLAIRPAWLALVAEADARGRRCREPRDWQRSVDNAALFVEMAREVGVLDRPHPFPSEHARFLYLRSQDPAHRPPDLLAHDDTRAEVIVMVGLPASGKDNWLAAHRPRLQVIGLDDLRVELEVDPSESQGVVIAAARGLARELCRRGQPFAWNATNVSRPLRASLIDLLANYHARIHLVYVEVPAAMQEQRNLSRAAPVPRAALDRMLKRWTVPTPAEAHRVTYAVEPMGPIGWPPA